MNRRQFLTRFGIGTAAAASVAVLPLTKTDDNPDKGHFIFEGPGDIDFRNLRFLDGKEMMTLDKNSPSVHFRYDKIKEIWMEVAA